MECSLESLQAAFSLQWRLSCQGRNVIPWSRHVTQDAARFDYLFSILEAGHDQPTKLVMVAHGKQLSKS